MKGRKKKNSFPIISRGSRGGEERKVDPLSKRFRHLALLQRLYHS